MNHTTSQEHPITVEFVLSIKAAENCELIVRSAGIGLRFVSSVASGFFRKRIRHVVTGTRSQVDEFRLLAGEYVVNERIRKSASHDAAAFICGKHP